MQVVDHPLVQIFDVCHSVQDTVRAEDVSIFGEQSCAAVSSATTSTHVMILALCFLALKCGSGNKKNSLVS